LENEYVQLKKIEAAREIASVLSQSKNVTYLPKGISPIINLEGRALGGKN